MTTTTLSLPWHTNYLASMSLAARRIQFLKAFIHLFYQRCFNVKRVFFKTIMPGGLNKFDAFE